jgi:XTP/dITP diphosphohydrolase
MFELVVASNNEGKIREILPLAVNMRLLRLADVGFNTEIPEPFFTFEQNANAKAATVYNFCGKNTFAEDSGLCVNALDGQPGVISAHYSGTRNDEQNLQKVLDELQGIEDRSAFYKAVICLIWNGEPFFFEGICPGTIATERKGTGGFGYDPVFMPLGYNDTFGNLPMEVKNRISHRSQALQKMMQFIRERQEDAIV